MRGGWAVIVAAGVIGTATAPTASALEEPAVPAAISSLRERTVAGMIRVMGPLPDTVRGVGSAPAVTFVEKSTLAKNGYRRITLLYDADGSAGVAADLYLPDDLKPGEKRAAVVALHPPVPWGSGSSPGRDRPPIATTRTSWHSGATSCWLPIIPRSATWPTTISRRMPTIREP